MARYTSQSITGYNTSPPSDDGSEVSANQITWAKHKTKLADPIKTLSEAINTELSNMDGRIYPSGVTTTATSLTLTKASHDGKNIRVTGSSTITLPQAATATTTFRCVITKTEASNTVTVDTQNSETIDGAASTTLTENGESIGVVTDGSNWFVDSRYLATLPYTRGFIDGFIMSNNGSDADHDIDIAAGKCRDGADSVNISRTSSITKQINAAWAAGSAAGGFPSGLTSGAVQASTWYRVFVILNNDGSTVDAGFDTSATATNLLADATDYTQYRQIGSVLTDGSANILAFKQYAGGYFEWSNPVLDVDDATPTATDAGETYTLSVPPTTRAFLNVFVDDSGGAATVYVRSTYATNDSPSTTTIPLATLYTEGTGTAGQAAVWADSSSQIEASVGSGEDNLRIATLGWWDPRGADA